MKGKNQFPKVTTESIIQRFKDKRGDEYDYSHVIYKNMHTNVAIGCKLHGIFYQTPHNHLKGAGCPECSKKRVADKNRMTVEEFIRRARKVHGDKYDYSKVVYVNNRTKVCIICPEHGEFWQTPCEHMKYGCKQCAVEYIGQKRIENSSKNFEERANEIHNYKYLYEKDTYKGINNLITVYCPIHGKFTQIAHYHLNGYGCPKCGIRKSENEDKICDFINSLGFKTEKHNRNIIKPNEIDIFIPNKDIGIEYDGLIWHSERYKTDPMYHLNKTEECKKKGIRLIHIFEDEWLEKEDIVKSIITNILGVSENKINAESCIIKEVTSKKANEFLSENYINEKCKAKVYIGLYYNNELVSLIACKPLNKSKKIDKNIWKICCFCNKLNTTIINGENKLLETFIKMVQPSKIIVYSDRRWENGNVYNKLGFTYIKNTKPNYFYTINQHRESRFKHIKQELNTNNKKYKIYDCGCSYFEKELNKKEDY